MKAFKRFWLGATVLSMVGMVLATDANDEKDLNAISTYKSWTRVNPAPIEVKLDVGSVGG
jgi:hypothetical protein